MKIQSFVALVILTFGAFLFLTADAAPRKHNKRSLYTPPVEAYEDPKPSEVYYDKYEKDAKTPSYNAPPYTTNYAYGNVITSTVQEVPTSTLVVLPTCRDWKVCPTCKGGYTCSWPEKPSKAPEPHYGVPPSYLSTSAVNAVTSHLTITISPSCSDWKPCHTCVGGYYCPKNSIYNEPIPKYTPSASTPSEYLPSCSDYIVCPTCDLGYSCPATIYKPKPTWTSKPVASNPPYEQPVCHDYVVCPTCPLGYYCPTTVPAKSDGGYASSIYYSPQFDYTTKTKTISVGQGHPISSVISTPESCDYYIICPECKYGYYCVKNPATNTYIAYSSYKNEKPTKVQPESSKYYKPPKPTVNEPAVPTCANYILCPTCESGYYCASAGDATVDASDKYGYAPPGAIVTSTLTKLPVYDIPPIYCPKITHTITVTVKEKVDYVHIYNTCAAQPHIIKSFVWPTITKTITSCEPKIPTHVPVYDPLIQPISSNKNDYHASEYAPVAPYVTYTKPQYTPEDGTAPYAVPTPSDVYQINGDPHPIPSDPYKYTIEGYPTPPAVYEKTKSITPSNDPYEQVKPTTPHYDPDEYVWESKTTPYKSYGPGKPIPTPQESYVFGKPENTPYEPQQQEQSKTSSCSYKPCDGGYYCETCPHKWYCPSPTQY